MRGYLKTATIAALAAAMMASAQAAAEPPKKIQPFTVLALRQACLSEDETTKSFCTGFVVSAFYTAASFGDQQPNIKVCPKTTFHASELAGVVATAMKTITADTARRPALFYVMQLLHNKFPC
jgi:hypothetical protein